MSTSRSLAPLALVLLTTALPLAAQDGPAFLVRDIDTSGEPIVIPPPPGCSSPATCDPIELFGSQPSQLLRMATNLVPTIYFAADDRVHGAELWRSDGTTAGTRLVADVCPGRCGSSPRLLGETGGGGDRKLLFWADDGTHGGELWQTDGTAQGTSLVADLCAGACSTHPLAEHSWLAKRPLPAGELDALYFQVGLALWKSDGTAAGTTHVLDLCTTPRCGAVLGEPHRSFALYFPVQSSAPAENLVGSLLRIVPGQGAPAVIAQPCAGRTADVRSLVSQGASILFLADCVAQAPVAGPTVYAWRVPTGETEALLDPAAGVPGEIVWAGLHYFPVSVVGQAPILPELWRTDGTAAGTFEALALPGELEGLEELTAIGGELAFVGVDPNVDFDLWWSRGSVTGVEKLLDGGLQELFPVRGSLLLFRRIDSTWGAELWVSDGSALGTRLVQDIAAGERGSFPADFVDLRSQVVFTADDGVHGRELWRLPLFTSGDGGVAPPHPAGPPIVSPQMPGFRVWVRITSQSGDSRAGAPEPDCIAETVCVSGAIPGRSEVFVRMVGPKLNGRLWPTLVKFTTSTVEIWIEQVATGEIEYYVLPGATPGTSELTGRFDREGFTPQ